MPQQHCCQGTSQKSPICHCFKISPGDLKYLLGRPWFSWTVSQSPSTALMAGNLPAIRAAQGTVSNIWKNGEIPTNLQSNATGAIPTYIDHQKGDASQLEATDDVPYFKDSTSATRLGLCNSLWFSEAARHQHVTPHWPISSGRDQSRYAPSQWETSLQCKDVSHWLGAYLDWSQLRWLGSCQMTNQTHLAAI